PVDRLPDGARAGAARNGGAAVGSSGGLGEALVRRSRSSSPVGVGALAGGTVRDDLAAPSTEGACLRLRPLLLDVRAVPRHVGLVHLPRGCRSGFENLLMAARRRR